MNEGELFEMVGHIKESNPEESTYFTFEGKDYVTSLLLTKNKMISFLCSLLNDHPSNQINPSQHRSIRSLQTITITDD